MSTSKRNSLYLKLVVIATVLLIVFFIVNKTAIKENCDTAYFGN